MKRPRRCRRFYIVQVVRGTRRVCNKRPLHQPVSSSYCGSTHREPGNPSNHGRAEKAGAYSSLPLLPGLPPPPGTPVPEFIPMLPGSQQCPGTPQGRGSWEGSLGALCHLPALKDVVPVASRAVVKCQPQPRAQGSAPWCFCGRLWQMAQSCSHQHPVPHQLQWQEKGPLPTHLASQRPLQN